MVDRLYLKKKYRLKTMALDYKSGLITFLWNMRQAVLDEAGVQIVVDGVPQNKVVPFYLRLKWDYDAKRPTRAEIGPNNESFAKNMQTGELMPWFDVPQGVREAVYNMTRDYFRAKERQEKMVEQGSNI